MKQEEELDSAKNKKNKGTAKKQNIKIGAINYKLTQMKKLKEKLEELVSQTEYLTEGSQLKGLKNMMQNNLNSLDDEQLRHSIENEISKLMESIEASKKNQNRNQ